jgi:hypothetical protein
MRARDDVQSWRQGVALLSERARDEGVSLLKNHSFVYRSNFEVVAVVVERTKWSHIYSFHPHHKLRSMSYTTLQYYFHWFFSTLHMIFTIQQMQQ